MTAEELKERELELYKVCDLKSYREGVIELAEQYANEKVKEEREQCIKDIYQLCGEFGEDREDIKSKLRELAMYLKQL